MGSAINGAHYRAKFASWRRERRVCFFLQCEFDMSNFIRYVKRTASTCTPVVALVGNPNSGKTSLFNALTGERQNIGNYPGVTVAPHTAECRYIDQPLEIVDLPGVFSLAACTTEEQLTIDFIRVRRPDVIIDVVDACNLRRHLYLAVQLIELGTPVVLAINKMDIASGRQLDLDLKFLADILGVPVVATVGYQGQGVLELAKIAAELATSRNRLARRPVHYGDEIESHLIELQSLIERLASHRNGMPRRCTALKLLEGDERVRADWAYPELLVAVDAARRHIEESLGDDVEALITQRRYAFISGLCHGASLNHPGTEKPRGARIDSFLADRYLGLPILLFLTCVAFHAAFALASPLMHLTESAFESLGVVIAGIWPAGTESLLKSLLVDGIVGGVGAVLVFLPNIFLLFLVIAIMEDCGYMARAALAMDHLMRKFGLNGRSFIPMLVGFGCSVPAIMATRSIKSRRDRLTTMLVLPLMSCSARLPIYALIIPAFFPSFWRAPMLVLIYMVGITLAALTAKLLKLTVFRGESTPFVTELPPYRWPYAKNVLSQMWHRVAAFMRKAGTIILVFSIILWAMQQWPRLSAVQIAQFAEQRASIQANSELPQDEREVRVRKINAAQAEATLEVSMIGKVGNAVEPLVRSCGFDWKISTSLLGAFAAKEVFLTQLGIAHSLGTDRHRGSLSLRETLQANYTPLQGFCVMVFCLISSPCMATIAVTRRESGCWKWALFQLFGLTLLAWIVTTAVYQIGSRLA